MYKGKLYKGKLYKGKLYEGKFIIIIYIKENEIM